jgi:hypothetical protein
MAVSMFPLASDESSEAAHLWLFLDEEGVLTDGDDRNLFTEGNSEITNHSGVKTYVSTTESTRSKGISGRSWQLAFHVTLMAMKEHDAIVRDNLARKWMITGRVSNTQVERVDIGAKTHLGTSRMWLVPNDNSQDLIKHRCRPVPSIEAAWSQILGYGVKEIGRSPWPDDPVVLHTFISAALGPVVASVLLSRVKKVVIWHTDNESISRKPAEAVRNILLKNIKPEVEVQPLREISSRSLKEAEQQLREALQEDLSTGKPVIFNITQGNRLMALAPHSLARERGNLWLVYRDMDAQDLDFTAIRYDSGGQAETMTLDGDPSSARVNWGYLLRKPSTQPEPDWNQILREITNIEDDDS